MKLAEPTIRVTCGRKSTCFFHEESALAQALYEARTQDKYAWITRRDFGVTTSISPLGTLRDYRDPIITRGHR